MAEFVEVMNKRKKICDNYELCIDCPLGNINNGYKTACADFPYEFPQEAEKIIMSWEAPVDWSKVKVDTPIYVSDFGTKIWKRRHFAKYENGKVYSWDNGKTSWSTFDDSNSKPWKYAKLAKDGE